MEGLSEKVTDFYFQLVAGKYKTTEVILKIVQA